MNSEHVNINTYSLNNLTVLSTVIGKKCKDEIWGGLDIHNAAAFK